MITKICLNCNKPFSPRPSRNNITECCGKQCKKEYNIKTHKRICKYCKKEFILKNIAYEKRGGGKYCSKYCGKYATKIYNFNENFFDKIDSEQKAYWLGFIMADGFNSNDELMIELSIIDLEHLSSFIKEIKADVPIKTFTKNNKNYKKAEEAYLKALQLNPNDAECWCNLGNCYKNNKNYIKAEEAY